MTEMEPYPKVYLYRRIVQAKMFIDQNYAEKLDLDNISDEAYYSKFHFIRLFKSVYGKTPHRYLQHVRIEKAKELLKSEVIVSEVCYRVGFESISSFSALFSKLVGLSPSLFLVIHAQSKKKILQQPLAFVPSCYAHQHGWLEK